MTVGLHKLALGAALLAASACSSPGQGDPSPTSVASCDLTTIAAGNCERAQALSLPQELPPSRGNKYADDEPTAMLGFQLFFEPRLGSGVGCMTCHSPELAFTDRLSVSKGKGLGTRNAPTVFNASRLSVFFWDGRGDSLWSQPLMAIENPLEMDSTRLEVAHLIEQSNLRAQYESVFGPLPDMTSWPAVGKPGDPGFDALPDDQKDFVNRLIANVGKALDAYQRRNSTLSANLDRFLGGDASAVIPAAQRGLAVFLKNGCDSCHSGPMLTDEKFHNQNFPSLPGAALDPGRADALPLLANNIFNLEGPYADPGPEVPGKLPTDTATAGEFRTPSLRNVTRTSPYGHDGALASLGDVLAIHAPSLQAEDKGDLLAFFETLNGDYPPKPWSNWPSPQ